MEIDPWASKGIKNYDEICEKFGLDKIDSTKLPNPTHLHRRGIIFAHRDLDSILNARKAGKPFGVLSGLMPSGQMHLGHKMVIDQAKWFQDLGGDVTIAVADLEAHATRGLSLEKCRKYAIEEYISNYAGMGLNPEKTSIYFQSERPIVQKMGFTLGTKTNLSEMEAIYGFSGKTNLAHIQSPLVQAGDIVHPQLDEYGGLRPIVVPVGVDQDPHLRLTRGLAGKTNWFNVGPGKRSGALIRLSVQEENAEALGQSPNGRIDRSKRQSIFDGIVNNMEAMGFSDIMSNPKEGTVMVPSATSQDIHRIRMQLLAYERTLGGQGLLAPSSTYHHFAVGLTGDKMSSSKPKTTIFLDDEIAAVEKKIKRAFSGGQPTIEEHRRLGGNPDIDVAYQYMMYFFEDDDDYLQEINQHYRSGALLAGEMKQLCIDRATEWLSNHQEKKDETAHLVDEFFDAKSL